MYEEILRKKTLYWQFEMKHHNLRIMDRFELKPEVKTFNNI